MNNLVNCLHKMIQFPVLQMRSAEKYCSVSFEKRYTSTCNYIIHMYWTHRMKQVGDWHAWIEYCGGLKSYTMSFLKTIIRFLPNSISTYPKLMYFWHLCIQVCRLTKLTSWGKPQDCSWDSFVFWDHYMVREWSSSWPTTWGHIFQALEPEELKHQPWIAWPLKGFCLRRHFQAAPPAHHPGLPFSPVCIPIPTDTGEIPGRPG